MGRDGSVAGSPPCRVLAARCNEYLNCSSIVKTPKSEIKIKT